MIRMTTSSSMSVKPSPTAVVDAWLSWKRGLDKPASRPGERPAGGSTRATTDVPWWLAGRRHGRERVGVRPGYQLAPLDGQAPSFDFWQVRVIAPVTVVLVIENVLFVFDLAVITKASAAEDWMSTWSVPVPIERPVFSELRGRLARTVVLRSVVARLDLRDGVSERCSWRQHPERDHADR